ncbi:MAG TPA: ATP-binding protein, partial [Gammaproteobacteria bacterium]
LDRTIQYQLQRAAASGRTALAPSIGVRPVAERVRDSLLKVYANKTLEFDIELTPDLTFRGDEGDLTELLGNLLDNACKWSSRQVRLSGTQDEQSLTLVVEDDGPGLSAGSLAELRARGARGDSTVPGQGIGLAIVDELVSGVYGGSLDVDRSPFGGARIRVAILSG